MLSDLCWLVAVNGEFPVWRYSLWHGGGYFRFVRKNPMNSRWQRANHVIFPYTNGVARSERVGRASFLPEKSMEWYCEPVEPQVYGYGAANGIVAPTVNLYLCAVG